MTEFNQVNRDGRYLKRVDGRFLLFTNSITVEFLNEAQTQSIPLYSTPEMRAFPNLEGVTAVLELRGFLGFDVNSEVRIEELAPFTTGHFDRSSFVQVRASDVFYPTITASYPVETNFIGIELTDILGNYQYHNIAKVSNQSFEADELAGLLAREFRVGAKFKPPYTGLRYN